MKRAITMVVMLAVVGSWCGVALCRSLRDQGRCPVEWGGPGRRMDRPREGPMMMLETLRGYLDVVDRYARLARDPVAAGVAAVVQANEILKPRGADAAITYFTDLQPKVKNEAVQRAIKIQLVELYKNSGQQDKALEQLQGLMTAAPAGSEMSTPPTPAR